MNAMVGAIDKLRRIEYLWEKLRGTKINTPEYKTLTHEIGVLSMEYQAVTAPDKKASGSR